MLDFGKGDSINQALAPGGVPLGIGQMRQRGVPPYDRPNTGGGRVPLGQIRAGGSPLV